MEISEAKDSTMGEKCSNMDRKFPQDHYFVEKVYSGKDVENFDGDFLENKDYISTKQKFWGNIPNRKGCQNILRKISLMKRCGNSW